MTLKTIITALTAILSLSAATASADDIKKGLRGPTSYQLDERITYSHTEKSKGITEKGCTFSPKLHLELLVDTPIDSDKIPESWNYGLFVRYNFE